MNALTALALSIPAEVYLLAWTVLLTAIALWGVRRLDRWADRWERRGGR